MTLRQIATAVTALGLSLATTGCASWIVIKQAEPNPFADLPSIGVVPLSFERCRVGERAEEEYKQSLSGARLKAWTEAKDAMVQSFFGQLKRRVVGFSVTPDVAGESYRVVSRITFIEPGADAGEVVQSSEVRMNASIVDKKGEVLDEKSSSRSRSPPPSAKGGGDREAEGRRRPAGRDGGLLSDGAGALALAAFGISPLFTRPPAVQSHRKATG